MNTYEKIAQAKRQLAEMLAGPRSEAERLDAIDGRGFIAHIDDGDGRPRVMISRDFDGLYRGIRAHGLLDRTRFEETDRVWTAMWDAHSEVRETGGDITAHVERSVSDLRFRHKPLEPGIKQRRAPLPRYDWSGGKAH